MDVSMVSSMPLAARASDEVGVAVLKKALDAEAQGALALIQALPQPQAANVNLPPHLGRNINVTA